MTLTPDRDDWARLLDQLDDPIVGVLAEALADETSADVATGSDIDDSADRPEDCDCGDWNDGLDLPCWPCYRETF